MDHELIQKIISGDKASFKHLYDKHIDKALRTAIAITKNQEIAKDAVQETFIRVYKNITSYDPKKDFAPWFYRILMNECNRLLKKESQVTALNQSFDDSEFKIASEEKEDYSDLYAAVQALSDIYRIPVILKYLHGFSEKEIATILALNHNTVKSRLLKGRQKLRECLEDQGRGA